MALLKFMKMAKVSLAPILTKLCYKCLQQECFPDEFKVGQIIQIPKTLAPKEIGEFRSTTLLNLFSKVFEKVVKSKFMDFIGKYTILAPDNRFTTDNTSKSSTELAITTIYDKFLNNLDKSNILVLYFSISKKLLILLTTKFY